MIKLTTYPSNTTYDYKTKVSALKDIRLNGLTRHQYTLIDTKDNTTYKGGLWLTAKELDHVRGFKTIIRGIRYIKYIRKESTQ